MTEMSMVELCKFADIPDGGALQITVEGFATLAVYRIGDEVFVTDDLCSHGEASLAEGELDTEDFVIECPFHQGGFDIRTGAAVSAPCIKAVRAYQATIEDGRVVISREA